MKLAALLLGVLVSSCTLALPDPVKVDSPRGFLDLTNWNFATQGPVIPQAWEWDEGLWFPATGRPALPPAQALGPPDQGGSFARVLMRPYGSGRPLAAATAHLKVLVTQGRSYGLQIGALPGAVKVWVNGDLVWETGNLSTDRRWFRADGRGTIVTVQPCDGVLDIVAELVSEDPLIRHSEVGRLWMIGPAAPMEAAENGERSWRFLQAGILLIGTAVFFWISRLRPERHALVYFTWFLGACFLKLVVNVEQPDPFFGDFAPGIPLSVYLFLNHGLNLLPFPLIALFLIRQFPQDLKMPAFWVIAITGAAATVWELLPFVVLAAGWEPLYSAIMHLPWAFFLNLYVVLATLFLFERCYHVFANKRPLSGALFLGGIIMGLIVLLPVPLSYFVPVKHTYFLGWGMFIYLMILAFALIQLQIRVSQNEARELRNQLKAREPLAHFVAAEWAERLGHESVEELRPGDRREAEAVLVRVWAPGRPEEWMLQVSQAAEPWKAVFALWREGAAIWALETLPETALAFALDVRRNLADASIAVVRAKVEFRVVEFGHLWIPFMSGMPERLSELAALGRSTGASVVLDAGLKDGLVVGGWRHHRSLTPEGSEIELYEADATAPQKEETLDLWERSLTHAREGRLREASDDLRELLAKHPDTAAEALLARWRDSR